MALPTEDKFLVTRAEMLDQLAMLLGGRTAEELVFHEPTTGAANDIEKATEVARGMVTEYGMSERLGARKFGDGDSEPFLGMEHVACPGLLRGDRVGDRRGGPRAASSPPTTRPGRSWSSTATCSTTWCCSCWTRRPCPARRSCEVFAPSQKRPLRGSYTGYGKRLPSDRPPVLTPKELALTAAGHQDTRQRATANGSAISGNGNGSQALGYSPNGEDQPSCRADVSRRATR